MKPFVVLTKVPRRIILELYLNNRKYYGLKLCRELNVTYSSYHLNKYFLEERGILQCIKGEREVHICLTDKGKELAKRIIILGELLE